MGVDDWIGLKRKFSDLKETYSIPDESEMKWEFLWLAKTNWDEFKKRHPDLEHLTFRHLLSFVTRCLEEMNHCSSCKLVFTVTKNASVGTSEERIWRMHLEDIMQRVEMQIDNRNDNLAVIFLDSISKSGEDVLRERYSELLRDGVFLEYRHIKDSIAFEYSHHSYAMQVADFCVGIFNGMLRGYEESINLFKLVYPKIIKDAQGLKFMGYGVCEVPTDKKGVRKEIEGLVRKAIEA